MKKTAISIFFMTPVCLLLVLGPFGSVAQAQERSELAELFDQFSEEEASPSAPEESSLEEVTGENVGELPVQDDSITPTVEEAVPDLGVGPDAFDAYRESIEGQSALFENEAITNSEGEEQTTPEDLEAEIREEAFNAAVNGFLPLRPEEIRRFLEVYDEVKQASNTPLYPYPRQESKVHEISLDPADPPEVIKLATGHVTTITFVDITGAKWPIFDMAWAGDFEVSPPDEGAAIIRIIPMSDYAYGNLSLRMSTLGTPIVFTLQAQREVAHVRYDAIVPKLGPFAKPQIVDRGSSPETTAGSVEVISVLDGTPPDSAALMAVEGADGRTKAYSMGASVYLRTPHTLISPAWTQSASSTDGMNVYVMKKTPVVLLSEKGKILRVFIKDKASNL